MGRSHITFRGNEKVYKILVGKTEGKRPAGRPMSRREYNIRMKLRVPTKVYPIFFWPG